MEAAIGRLVVCGILLVVLIIQLIIRAIKNSRDKKRIRKCEMLQRLQYPQQAQPQYVQSQQARPQNMKLPELPNSRPLPQLPKFQQLPELPQCEQPQVRFHVYKNGMRVGPFSMQQLGQMAKSRQLTGNNFMWKQGMVGWKRALEIPELAMLFLPEIPKQF